MLLYFQRPQKCQMPEIRTPSGEAVLSFSVCSLFIWELTLEGKHFLLILQGYVAPLTTKSSLSGPHFGGFSSYRKLQGSYKKVGLLCKNGRKNMVVCPFSLTLLHSERPKLSGVFGCSECNRVKLCCQYFRFFAVFHLQYLLSLF